MKIKGKQEVVADVDVIDFLMKLQIVGREYSFFKHDNDEYYFEFKDETKVNPWTRRQITKEVYDVLVGLECAKTYLVGKK